MIDTVVDHIVSLLQSPILYQGGNAYPGGSAPYANAWQGTILADNGGAEQGGWVNIYEKSYQEGGADERPAVYLGLPSQETLIHRGDPVASGTGLNRVEFWWAELPLVIVASSYTSLRDARKQRNQLLANVLQILWPKVTETNDWWDLGFADHQPIQLKCSGTGGAEGVGEAIAIVMLKIAFSQSGNSPA